MRLSSKILKKLSRLRNVATCLIMLASSTYMLSAQIGQANLAQEEKSCYSEELHLTTDRDLYAAGEKIWLKVWKINSLTRKPDQLSKVVYAEILDLENNPLDQVKIAMNGSTGSASINLPDTLRTGSYILRAYTGWMTNFSQDLFAFRTISVINPFDKLSNFLAGTVAARPDSIEFFPEGGQLIAGLETRLGIRAFGKKGLSPALNAAIVSQAGDTLCKITTGAGGYGICTFRPAGDQKYFIVARPGSGKWIFPLPEVKKEGISITVRSPEEPGSSLLISVSPGFSPDVRKYYLTILSNGLSPVKRLIDPAAGQGLSIDRSSLPAGLSCLAVHDDQGRLISSRWVSTDFNGELRIKADISREGAASRDRVNLSVSTTDMTGKAVAARLSVSISKTAGVKINRTGLTVFRQLEGMESIFSDCATGDPDDYLLFRHPALADGMGPGRTDMSVLRLPEPGGHLVSGTIREKNSGEALRNEALTLSMVGRAALCLFTRTDNNGNFYFPTNEQGLKEIVIQPLKPGKDTYVDLNNPFLPGRSDYAHPPVAVDTSGLEALNNLLVSMQVNRIYEPLIPLGDNIAEPARNNFYGRPDKSILMSKFIELTSVREIVAELIPGVATVRSGGTTGFRLTKPYQTQPFEEGPMVLVDGIPVSDIDKVIAIPSSEIEKVDVLIDRYYIAGNVIDGIIHFITRKGNLSAMEADKKVFRMEYDLLRPPGRFFSPDYSNSPMKESRIPDFRNTLLWNPDLVTDQEGKAETEFFTSDESASYLITIEGMTDDGRRGSLTLPLVTGAVK